MFLYMITIHFLQPLSSWLNKHVCVCLHPMLSIHSWQMLSNQKQHFKLSVRNLALMQISETDFKFFLASEHFNNSSSFSLATDLCLTLHKKLHFSLFFLLKKQLKRQTSKYFQSACYLYCCMRQYHLFLHHPEEICLDQATSQCLTSVMLQNLNQYHLQENSPSALSSTRYILRQPII